MDYIILCGRELSQAAPSLAIPPSLTLDAVAAFEGSVQAGDGVGHGRFLKSFPSTKWGSNSPRPDKL